MNIRLTPLYRESGDFHTGLERPAAAFSSNRHAPALARGIQPLPALDRPGLSRAMTIEVTAKPAFSNTRVMPRR